MYFKGFDSVIQSSCNIWQAQHQKTQYSSVYSSSVCCLSFLITFKFFTNITVHTTICFISGIKLIGLQFLGGGPNTPIHVLLCPCVQVQKAVKKSARREQLIREEVEQQRLKTVLELQFLLDQLGDNSVRQNLKRPDATGSPFLTDADLTSLDEFYKLVGPDRNCNVRYESVWCSLPLNFWRSSQVYTFCVLYIQFQNRRLILY